MTDTLQQQRIVNVLHQRAHDLLLGHSFANQQIGFIHTLDLNDGKPVKKRSLKVAYIRRLRCVCVFP